MTDALPDDVISLIHRSVVSMDHVEALLALRDGADRPLAIDEIAQRGRLREDAVESIMADLAAAGLVVQADLGYRYRAHADHDDAVTGLAEAYNVRPVTLVRAIYARPSPIRLFGDRFRD